MKQFLYTMLTPASPHLVQFALCCMRIGIGVLTMLHGVPKIMGGIPAWQQLGTAMNSVGIYFLPVMWGFFGASAEFFGGIALVLGLGTRLASFALAIMMVVAAAWHINRGDSYQVYSFALSLIVVFIAQMIIGGGYFSLDSYVARNFFS